MNLDFSVLSDDQLLQLIQAAMNEAIARGTTVAYAAQSEFIDAKERARIEAEAIAKAQVEAAKRERERVVAEAEAKAKKQAEAKVEQQYATEQQRIWGKQKALHLALKEWGVTEDHAINVWSRGGDKRVYFQQDTARHGWKFCYYITGNNYHAPGELEYEYLGAASDERIKNISKSENQSDFKALERFLEEVGKKWNSLKSSSDSALVAKVAPFEKHLEDYREALTLTVEAIHV